MLAALQNVRPSHLLDRDLWRTLGVHAAPEDEHQDGASRPHGIITEQRLVRS
jgi:hypothetical protein